MRATSTAAIVFSLSYPPRNVLFSRHLGNEFFEGPILIEFHNCLSRQVSANSPVGTIITSIDTSDAGNVLDVKGKFYLQLNNVCQMLLVVRSLHSAVHFSCLRVSRYCSVVLLSQLLLSYRQKQNYSASSVQTCFFWTIQDICIKRHYRVHRLLSWIIESERSFAARIPTAESLVVYLRPWCLILLQSRWR